MRIELIKSTGYKDSYLGFCEISDIPKKCELIYYLGHDYKVLDVRDNCLFVKLIS